MVSDAKKKREAAKKAKASAKLHGTEGSPSVSTSTVGYIPARVMPETMRSNKADGS